MTFAMRTSQLRLLAPLSRASATSRVCRALAQQPRFSSSISNSRPFAADLLHRERVISDSVSRATLRCLSNWIDPDWQNCRTLRSPAFASRRLEWSTVGQVRHGAFLVHFCAEAHRNLRYLEDGTNTFHWPGEPWNSRVWAGGSITWSPDHYARAFVAPAPCGIKFRLGEELRCLEEIKSVELKPGQPGKEKILVETERVYGGGLAIAPTVRGTRSATPQFEAVREVRNLVFMPKKTEEEAKATLQAGYKVLKPAAHMQPDLAIMFTPRQPLLAEFSALTHNAHRIHLDRSYAAQEGFRNLVVHGPLSLHLMVRLLETVIDPTARIVKLDYRNLMPLFCDEEMKICVRRAQTDVVPGAAADGSNIPIEQEQEHWDVWIEGSNGGYAVKGTAIVTTQHKSPLWINGPLYDFARSLAPSLREEALDPRNQIEVKEKERGGADDGQRQRPVRVFRRILTGSGA